MKWKLLVFAVLASTALPAHADDWPTYLGPTRDGKSSETELRLSWPDAGPPIRWERHVGEGYGSASIAGRRAFFYDRHGDTARLTCFDAESGEELWRAEHGTDYEDMYGFGGGPRCSPVVDDERVFTFGAEGRLRAHGVSDGKLLWEVDTARRYGVVQNFFGVGSTPVVEGDLLIVVVGGSPPESAGIQSGKVRGNGSGIVAFDKKTGEERWRSSDELAGYSSPVVAEIRGRRLGLAFVRGGLIGFDPESGKVGFEFPWRARKPESVNAANPVIVGDRVFLTESYGPGGVLLRVRHDGYEVLRKDPPREQSLAAHWMTPVHHDGVLYGCHGAGSGEAELRAVDLASGKVHWHQDGLGRTTLIYVDRHLIVLTERGRLLVVRATPKAYHPVSDVTLQARGSRLLEYPAWNPPVLSGGLLYLRGKDRLVCLDLRKPQAQESPAP